MGALRFRPIRLTAGALPGLLRRSEPTGPESGRSRHERQYTGGKCTHNGKCASCPTRQACDKKRPVAMECGHGVLGNFTVFAPETTWRSVAPEPFWRRDAPENPCRDGDESPKVRRFSGCHPMPPPNAGVELDPARGWPPPRSAGEGGFFMVGMHPTHFEDEEAPYRAFQPPPLPSTQYSIVVQPAFGRPKQSRGWNGSLPSPGT